MTLRILFAASEVFPLIKTGGLADVVGSLPSALMAQGADVRIAVPAYRDWRSRVETPQQRLQLSLHGHTVTVWEAKHPQLDAPLWLFDCAELFDRPGDPYHDAQGLPWLDNGLRFGLFSEAVAIAAEARETTGFDTDVLHAHDWQAGLSLPWLRERDGLAAGVFTIHNLAYQGNYPASLCQALGLPAQWWQIDGVEFHGELSQLKAGIVYADHVTTVSPTYAAEIQTAQHGIGMAGLLHARSTHLSGILNGIDTEVWNPQRDKSIAYRYDARRVTAGKRANKTALQQQLGLTVDDAPLLIGVVTRFAHQKGIDLLCDALPTLMRHPLQFAILGNGDPFIAATLRAASEQAPGRIALHEGFDEALAHRIVASADVFLMPSRYEPCGLTQMYSQRYGTVPIVHHTGGLADSVTDTTEQTLADGSASGIHFLNADVGGVLYGIERALQLREDSRAWKAVQRTGMARDFSWAPIATAYLSLYRKLINQRRPAL
ncbi:glycogen synthase GlgA [Sinimarinibacterium sp. CAU 1509]|uniref:glycogen synthase GlgA n=1 Tax=Sinimarinibacterium sp. CAU 1509 TaxID=2562283 RepID=UPI00146CD508|nr:glycogen synthase GlgA [Sinimarinibacterium sp. CAU 1509]